MRQFVALMIALYAPLAAARTPVSAEIIPLSMSVADDRTGDVVAVMEDGTRERLTQNKHCLDPKVGPKGMVGWVWASEKYKGTWVSSHLRVQLAKKLVIEVKSDKPFIEAWAFSPQGVVTKSRALHGPATIELFSIEDGRRIGSTDAFADDLPVWAKPFREE